MALPLDNLSKARLPTFPDLCELVKDGLLAIMVQIVGGVERESWICLSIGMNGWWDEWAVVAVVAKVGANEWQREAARGCHCCQTAAAMVRCSTQTRSRIFFPILKPHQAWGGAEHIRNGENSHKIPQFYHNSTLDISL